MNTPSFLGLVLSLSLLAGCGGGNAGSAVRPTDPSAKDALGESPSGGGSGLECKSAPAHAEPLVVDWKTNDQLELTVAMQKGVALVAYDCKSIRLVKGCSLAGQYAFTAVPSVLQEAVQISDADEVKASLPFSGGSLSGEVARGSSIDIALAYVGKRSTVNDSVVKTQLTGGECGSVTHFVRGATIGAFAMATGTKGQVRAAADIFGAGASGGSSSNKKKLNSAGEVSSCKGVNGTSANPPDNCGAIVRLELVQIGGLDLDDSKPPPPLGNTCPEGFTPANGRCAKKAAASGGYRCDPNDRDDCKAQCKAGNAESCYNAALSLIVGAEIGGPRQQEAMPMFETACKANIGRACFWMGSIYANDPKLPDGPVNAGEYAKKSCDLLVPEGCGLEAAREMGIDATKRFSLYKRACDLGHNPSCINEADNFFAGRGANKDPQAGVKILTTMCDANDKTACERLMSVYKNNKDVKDPAKADDVKKRACDRGVKLYGCDKK